MYKAKYLQPQPRTGSDTVLHLKTYEPLTSGTDKLFDYSLKGHIGTLKGTAVLKFPGCDLDGDSDYIEIADHADFSPIGTPFSISKWVYMHDATNFIIANKGKFGTNGEWSFFTNSEDKLIFVRFDESADAYIGQKSDNALTSYENSWVNLIVTSDGSGASSGIKLYLDGVLLASSAYEAGSFTEIENLTANVDIGRYSI